MLIKAPNQAHLGGIPRLSRAWSEICLCLMRGCLSRGSFADEMGGCFPRGDRLLCLSVTDTWATDDMRWYKTYEAGHNGRTHQWLVFGCLMFHLYFECSTFSWLVREGNNTSYLQLGSEWLHNCQFIAYFRLSLHRAWQVLCQYLLIDPSLSFLKYIWSLYACARGLHISLSSEWPPERVSVAIRVSGQGLT